MNSLLTSGLVALALTIVAPLASAQKSRDANAGFAYADGVCAECHAVKRGQRVSPHERAPAFEVVANSQGITEMALRVWFQSSHPSMPNLMLTEKQSDDMIAYIMSLKGSRRPGSGS